MAQDQWTLQEKESQKREPPLQARVVAANRTVCTTTFTTILAHMEMNRGKAKLTERGKNDEKGSGHGMAKVARQANKKPAEHAAAGGHSRQTICPAQALKKQTASR